MVPFSNISKQLMKKEGSVKSKKEFVEKSSAGWLTQFYRP
jgi:hypothetical protein